MVGVRVQALYRIDRFAARANCSGDTRPNCAGTVRYLYDLAEP